MIETERLHLRPWRADELEASHALTDDEESRRFLGGFSRREDSYRRLIMTVGGWAQHGFGSFAVEERATGAIVGTGGLFRMVRTLDIEMPEMDGLTAMRHIREQPRLSSLPVIALTAKAMSDDRERCLEAGASDYIAKPIDIDKLVSLCRVWMPK